MRHRNVPPRSTAWLGSASLGLALALAAISGAAAHAHFNHSTPAPGEVIAGVPARIDIFTDQDMAKVAGANSITVTNPEGTRVDDGNCVVDDADRRHFSVGLTPNLPAGRYVVAYTTLSDVDGDTDHGRFAFYAGAAPTAQQKRLDAQLTTSQPATPSNSSHTGPFIIGALAAVALLVAAAGIFVARRRPS